MSEADSQNALGWLDDAVQELKANHLFRELRVRESPHVSGKVQLNGEQLINFGSNDYLSISADHRLVDAVKSNVGYVGWGSAASPLIHGRGTLHQRLENELAKFEQREAALTFSSGFAANVGVISSLVGKPDVIFSDQLNHASIIDGCKLSGATVVVYSHGNTEDLAKKIESSAGQFRRQLIVTDGLFSMEGDLAPLPDLVKLAKASNSMLLVDEAHATGVFGERGSGASEHFGVHEQVDVIVGTLSKSLGCHGGFVAGSQPLIDWITNSARSYIFSTAVPDATCMAAVTAIGLVGQMTDERNRLLQRANSLRSKLTDHGLDVGLSQSQIIPVKIGDPQKVLDMGLELRKRGYFVPAIRPPAVPAGDSLLRISLNIQHNDEMIEQLSNSLIDVISPN